MDKNEAFEIVVSVVSQVNSFNLIQARQVDEAIQTLAKELEYKPKKVEHEVEDLENPKKK